MAKETFVSEETLYTGKILTLKRQTVRLADGRTALREVVHTTGSAGVLALDKAQRALFVRQWRAPLGQETLELIAGRIEVGEKPLATAKRELNEEAGLQATNWRPLSTFYQAAGFSDAQCHLFVAEGLAPVSHKRPQDDGEAVVGEWLSLAQAQVQQAAGVICDAKTVLGLALWANLGGEGDGRRRA
ncbi:NUDIX domain-containing protein [Lacticaseibacillus sp. GG6-2]